MSSTSINDDVATVLCRPIEHNFPGDYSPGDHGPVIHRLAHLNSPAVSHVLQAQVDWRLLDEPPVEP